jgi:hypothetical protein
MCFCLWPYVLQKSVEVVYIRTIHLCNEEVTQILMYKMIMMCKTLTMAEVISNIPKLQFTEFQTCLFNDPISVA